MGREDQNWVLISKPTSNPIKMAGAILRAFAKLIDLKLFIISYLFL
jgi:hypothetical protein